MNRTAVADVREEIEALHRFFVAWFAGRCARDDETVERELLQRLDERFVLIQPGGALRSRADFSSGLRSAHGTNPDFRIAIRDVQIRHSWNRHLLATYEEWQRNARASTPPDNGRLSTVLFEVADGFKWLHVHETWLPETVMRAGPYDF